MKNLVVNLLTALLVGTFTVYMVWQLNRPIKAGATPIAGATKQIMETTNEARLVIFEPYQNKGYGTEVVKTLVEQGYNSLWVRSDNPRAIHVYEKCGFKKGNTHMFEMVAESEDKE